jgi:hypothetical protein
MHSIPEDLMERLRQANEQFHQARLRLDEVDGLTGEQRREMAAAMRAAEQEVEAVNREISALLGSDAKGNPDASPGAPPTGH